MQSPLNETDASSLFLNHDAESFMTTMNRLLIAIDQRVDNFVRAVNWSKATARINPASRETLKQDFDQIDHLLTMLKSCVLEARHSPLKEMLNPNYLDMVEKKLNDKQRMISSFFSPT